MIKLLESASIEEFIKKYQDGYFGGIVPKNDEIPCPWDPDIELEGDTVVITGNLTPNGPNMGTCTCRVKKNKFFDLYDLM